MFEIESMPDDMDIKNQIEEFDFDKRFNIDDASDEVHYSSDTDESGIDFDERITGSVEEWSDFVFSDLFDMNEVLEFFEPEIFDQLSDDEKAFVIDILKEKLIEELQLANPPEVVIAELDDEAINGFLAPEFNAVVINAGLLKDGGQLRNTLAHEMRHAWQHERVEQPEELQTTFDKALKENFENYIAAEDNYRLYRSQLGEMDAREFATRLVEDMYYSQV